MKKNKMMRIASVLMVATLLSTCAISGTFAKYVTEGSTQDSARVAKFGVLVTADGNLFANTYKAADTNSPGVEGDANTENNIALTVVSFYEGVSAATDLDNVVAPGTKNNEGLTLAVTGTPEVAVHVEIAVKDDQNIKEIFLAAGEYVDLTKAPYEYKFTVADNGYYPVKFTLKQGEITLVDGGKLDDVVTALKDFTGDYAPNTKLAEEIGTLTLTWEWAYEQFDGEGEDKVLNVNADKADTLLGDLATNAYGDIEDEAVKKLLDDVSTNDYSLNTSIEITITVTQID